MSRPLGDAVGRVMALDDYYADFQRNFVTTREFWKLERGQEFAEPGDASWEAFDRGDWDESMRFIEKRRADLIDYFREVAAAGTHTRRIRIVSLPLTPYLQWELNLLKIRDEIGGPIRVLPVESVRELEDQGPLPEPTGESSAKVIVISGSAGVGKTALALRWAHAIRSQFPAGELYVNLRGYDDGPPQDPTVVLDRMLRALGVPGTAIPADTEDRSAALRSLLADRV